MKKCFRHRKKVESNKVRFPCQPARASTTEISKHKKPEDAAENFIGARKVRSPPGDV